MHYTQSQKETMKALVYQAFHYAILNHAIMPVPSNLDKWLKEKRGVFVTLTAHNELRGCIGYVMAEHDLGQAICDNAYNAALRDPRFDPVLSDEIPNIQIELSILSPIETVADISQIKIGRDGLIVQIGERSGLLLPQVATEYGWSREEFLSATCQKARLPSDAWKQDASIYKFSAVVF